MTTKHTPGPWHWEHGDYLKPDESSPAGIAVVLEFDGCRVERDCDIEAMQAEIEANKRLIGAAPELLQALQEILAEPYGCRFCDSGKLRNTAKPHDSCCGFELARAAIAKAVPA